MWLLIEALIDIANNVQVKEQNLKAEQIERENAEMEVSRVRCSFLLNKVLIHVQAKIAAMLGE